MCKNVFPKIDHLKEESKYLQNSIVETKSLLKQAKISYEKIRAKQQKIRTSKINEYIKKQRNLRRKPKRSVIDRFNEISITEDHLKNKVETFKERLKTLKAQQAITKADLSYKNKSTQGLEYTHLRQKATAVAKYDDLDASQSLTMHKRKRPTKFRRAQSPLYRATHPDTDLKLDVQDLTSALKEVNKNIKYSDDQIIKSVLIELALHRPRSFDQYALDPSKDHCTREESEELIVKDSLTTSLTFLEFCTVAALAEAAPEISSLVGRKKYSTAIIQQNDFRLSSTSLLFKAKQLRDHYEQLFRDNSLNNLYKIIGRKFNSCKTKL